VALLVSGLTLFSGFGLGTLLMPAFALNSWRYVIAVIDRPGNWTALISVSNYPNPDKPELNWLKKLNARSDSDEALINKDLQRCRKILATKNPLRA
jgi:hypothetical protein